jgi:hypothetical protein
MVGPCLDEEAAQVREVCLQLVSFIRSHVAPAIPCNRVSLGCFSLTANWGWLIGGKRAESQAVQVALNGCRLTAASESLQQLELNPLPLSAATPLDPANCG